MKRVFDTLLLVTSSCQSSSLYMRTNFEQCSACMSRFTYPLLWAMIAPELQAKVQSSNLEARSASNCCPLSVDKIMCIGTSMLFGVLMYRYLQFSCICSAFFAVIKSNAGPIWFPSSPSALQGASNLMDKVGTRHHQYYGCVGAIDDAAICIRQPGQDDCPSPISYRNRKDFSSINMQAIAGGCLHYLLVCMSSPGSTHDSTAFHMTAFANKWLLKNTLLTRIDNLIGLLPMMPIEHTFVSYPHGQDSFLNVFSIQGCCQLLLLWWEAKYSQEAIWCYLPKMGNSVEANTAKVDFCSNYHAPHLLLSQLLGWR